MEFSMGIFFIFIFIGTFFVLYKRLKYTFIKPKYYRVVYCNNGKIQYSIPMVEEVAKDYLEIFDDAIRIEEVKNDFNS